MGAAGSGQLRFSFPVSREEHARALKASMARGPAAAMTRGMAIIFALVGVGVLIASASRTQVGPSAIMEAMPWLLLASFWAWLYRGIPLRWYTRAINRTMRQFPGEEVRELSEELGTTKSTIQGIRDRTHWNAAALTPLDPVTLGLCSQIDLDFEVQRASKEKPVPVEQGATLLPAAVTTAPPTEEEAPAAAKEKDEDLNVNAVFAKLKQLGGKSEDKD